MKKIAVLDHGKSVRTVVLECTISLLLFSTICFSSGGIANDCKEKATQGDAVTCLQNKIESIEGKYQDKQFSKGMIIMWSGNMHQIPKGWALCDGKDSRPNLRDRFILGAGAHYPIGEVGGTDSHNHGNSTSGHSLTAAQLPPHSHRMGTGGTDTFKMAPGGVTQRLAHFLSDQYNGGAPKSTHTDGGSGRPHSHAVNSDKHIPPYYALAFIIKL